jgi:DNA gyrase/topoisomerase IV subunit A/MFS-type transporter involved in bile tolerance (Atg22 family)
MALLDRLGLHRPELRAWAMYDWANSAFVTIIITAIFPSYYLKVANAGDLASNPAIATQRLAITTTIALALVAVLAPILGAIADAAPVKKKFLAFFMGLGVLSTAAMYTLQPGQWQLASLLFALGNIGAMGSFVFYDSLLPHIARVDEVDRVSTAGYALGYVSGGVVLLAAIQLIEHPTTFGLADAESASRMSFLIVALWWVAFSIPLFRRVPEPTISRHERLRGLLLARNAIVGLRQSARELRRYRQAMLFLVAFLIYNDGVGTIIKFAVIYGEEIGLDTAAMIKAILLVQFVGIPCTLLFGQLAGKVSAKTAIYIGLLIYAGVSVLGFFMTTATHFFLLAALVGLVQGGVQALSRSLFSTLIPPEKSSEFFGVFAVFEKFAGILGPLLFALVHNVTPVAIEQEMRSSFMDYAMSVIVSRALPDARDGLKPVHRRILFAQKGLSNFTTVPTSSARASSATSSASTTRTATARSTTRWSAWPRTSRCATCSSTARATSAPSTAIRRRPCVTPSAAWPARRRSCSPISTRRPSTGSPTTTTRSSSPRSCRRGFPTCSSTAPRASPSAWPPTSRRTTSARSSTPPWRSSRTRALRRRAEPDRPRSRLPHRRHHPGPQRHSPGQQTGPRLVTVRGRCHFEEIRKDRQAIIVTEMPYMVNKASWIESAAMLVRDKKLEGISDIRDESDRTGMRVVFELKRDANDQVVLNNLYKMTQLQSNFGVNTLAIVTAPQRLSLRECAARCSSSTAARWSPAARCTICASARERREIVEGLGLAIMQIDRVIEIIRSSKDTDEAKTRLIKEKMMGLDGFLERAGSPRRRGPSRPRGRLRHLTAPGPGHPRHAPRSAHRARAREARGRVPRALGADRLPRGPARRRGQAHGRIVEELREIREQYGDERRTEIVESEGEILHEELIAVEEMVVTRTHLGYVKRTPVASTRPRAAAAAASKGASSGGTDDFVADMFVASTHDFLLSSPTEGRVYLKKVYELPAGAAPPRASPSSTSSTCKTASRSSACCRSRNVRGTLRVFMATRLGTVKKTERHRVRNIRSSGIRAIGIDEGDRLVDVRLTMATWTCCCAPQRHRPLRFQEDQVRPMGRDARGVRGINLREGDELVGMARFARLDRRSLVTVCERGYGKRTSLASSRQEPRRLGVIASRPPSRNGPVTGVRLVEPRTTTSSSSPTRASSSACAPRHLTGGPQHPGRPRHAPRRGRASPRIERLADTEEMTRKASRPDPGAGRNEGDTVPVDMERPWPSDEEDEDETRTKGEE